jgi:hypothetical protein
MTILSLIRDFIKFATDFLSLYNEDEEITEKSSTKLSSRSDEYVLTNYVALDLTSCVMDLSVGKLKVSYNVQLYAACQLVSSVTRTSTMRWKNLYSKFIL